MAIFEAFGSRDYSLSRKDGKLERNYVLTGSDDETTLMNTLLATAPTAYQGLVYQEYSLKQLGPETWEGSVSYGPAEKEESQDKLKIGEFTFTFDTGGGKQKITQTSVKDMKVQGYNAPDTITPNFKGGINVTDNEVEGVEVVVPALKFALTYRVPGGRLDFSYIKKVAEATGKINGSPFLFAEGREVLFMGATGSFKKGETIEREIGLHFEFSPNKKQIAVGDIVVAEKGGWDYMWVHFRKHVDAGASAVVMTPVAAYVHKIYDEYDFSQLFFT